MEDKSTTKYDFSNEDVRLHLNMQQDIINRMATNSSNCKTWAVTLLAAMTALQCTVREIAQYGWVMIAIVFMFWFLDAYYLMLERIYRKMEKDFVDKLERDNWKDDISCIIFRFSTNSEEQKMKLLKGAMWSPSCKYFYLTLIALCCLMLWGDDALKGIQSLLIPGVS